MPVPVKVRALFVSARLTRRKAGQNMDGETNGGQEATQGAQDQAQQQGQGQQETQQQGQSQVETPDYEKQIAERDEKIASLEAQVAEAAKNAETAEQLRGEIAELKAQGESDRIDFKLQLAGVRNVKAARALLADHGKDVDELKEAEPWLFEATGKHVKGGLCRLRHDRPAQRGRGFRRGQDEFPPVSFTCP